jgi:hypothetical protein
MLHTVLYSLLKHHKPLLPITFIYIVDNELCPFTHNIMFDEAEETFLICVQKSVMLLYWRRCFCVKRYVNILN